MAAALFQPFPISEGRRAQIYRYAGESRRPRHFHVEPEINVVVRGQGVFGLGDRQVPVSTGSVLVYQPGQDHVLLEESSDLELFVIALRPELASRVWQPRGATSSRAIELSTLDLADLEARMRALCGVNDANVIEHALAEVFRSVSLRLIATPSISRRVLTLVSMEPSVSGAALAQRLRTTQSALSRCFKRDLGLTFVEFRSRVRLMRFVSLVDAGKSFGRAALEADFGSYVQCHRVFQRVLGCSPMDYFAGARKGIDEATFRVASP